MAPLAAHPRRPTAHSSQPPRELSTGKAGNHSAVSGTARALHWTGTTPPPELGRSLHFGKFGEELPSSFTLPGAWDWLTLMTAEKSFLLFQFPVNCFAPVRKLHLRLQRHPQLSASLRELAATEATGDSGTHVTTTATTVCPGPLVLVFAARRRTF
ncbi:hypothetical protein CKAH01_08800 [Colletotrichum kahawae]|uniref:Uncharacterized protein n=1 Tax=Colletotrichum kahawae TaxID=34407 RepID=A0AAD9Y2L7_COLKA|nr:hypothetical protein CKAH01_08800 [Colletotrichum kahawae]